MPAEFALIAQYFARAARRADVRLGIGDDAAVLRPPPGMELVASTDTLVGGVHFLPDCAPRAVGHKALAANLSDLAAMGADPAWVLLAITLPGTSGQAREGWLEQFMAGFDALAGAHGADLVGGDTTAGPLAITVTVLGLVPAGQALTRAGARVGDGVYVSGSLGGAGVGQACRRGRTSLAPELADAVCARLEYPQPRVALGRALRGRAHAAIDVSDGLAADLGHVLAASGVGARVALADLPLGPGVPDTPAGRLAALTGGDDYELCFTAPDGTDLGGLEAAGGCALTRIGRIEAAPGLRVIGADGAPLALARAGYEHDV